MRKLLALITFGLGLAACGHDAVPPPGGNGAPLLAADPTTAPRSSLLANAIPAPLRQQNQSTVPPSPAVISADEFFDWAESALPTILVGAPPSQTVGDFRFRYYPASDTYLAVYGGNLALALGPITGGQILQLGDLQLFACASRPAGCAIPLTGLVAYGPAVASAAVTVTDPTGTVVCNTTSESNGRFACQLPPGARGPFALRARADDVHLASIAPSAYPANTNVTPLTTLLVSRLVPSGNPADLISALAAEPALGRAASLQAATAQIQRILAPVLVAAADGTDPLKGEFAPGSSAHARVLSALQVSIRPEESTSNIEITVKTRPADDAGAPLKVSFRSVDQEPPSLPAGSVTAQTLPAATVEAQIADFLARAMTCYALPLAQRVRNVPAGASAVVGTAADVVAPACRQLYVDDDPATFLDNGLRVGRDANGAGASTGLFRESATGSTFDTPVLQHQRANGDIVITFRAVGADGAVTYPTPLTLRAQGGTLRNIGNQAVHDITVRPILEDREFLKESRDSYLSTGYSVLIRNRLGSDGGSIYSKVTVTDPQGRVFDYLPRAGRTFMTSAQKSCCSSQRIAAAYTKSYSVGLPGLPTIEGPALRDTALLYVQPQLSDSAITAIPDQGVWRFDITFSDPARPPETQTVRTLSRPMTLGEIRKLKIFQFTSAYKAVLSQQTNWAATNTGYVFGPASASNPNVFVVGTADGGPGWLVEDDSLPWPTSVTIFSANGTFDEAVGVTRGTFRATVTCQKTASHCSAATGIRQFAEGGRIHTIELAAVTRLQMVYSKTINLYVLP
jgi:hypothetical protein